MTSEERMKLYSDFHDGVRMMMDKLERAARSKDAWTLSEMGCISDIMKDLAVTEKAIAKAHHIFSKEPEDTY